jgi:NAD(P)-dependent dehydrogenase (short-subunit alcohol dehydrogenase family)
MKPSLLLSYSLDGHTALVTGGGTGIGRAVTQCLLAAGAKVIITGRRADVLDATAAELGDGVIPQVMDVTDTASIPALTEALAAAHGQITILINNAGVHVKKPFVETTEADLLRVFQTHVLGALALSRALEPGMRAAGGGSIVFMSSMAALFGIPKVSAYTVAKSALTGAVRALAVELGEANIRVNAVAPGWIETAMSRQALDGDPARKARSLGRTPWGRLGEPSDVGWAVAYLCSPAARFITGTVMPVDGGASMGF